MKKYSDLSHTEKREIGLEKFWMIMIYEFNKSNSDMGHQEAIDFANEGELFPVNERYCMQKLPDSGWWLLEASGSAIIRATEGGDL